MNKSLLIKNCQTFSAKQPKSKKSSNICHLFGAKLAFMALFAMVAVSSLGYIFQINQLATMGQEINGKEQVLGELQEANKALEIQVAQLKSSYHFETERERLNLVNPDQVSFIEIERSTEMAMAK
jgi:cell division protein FtsB